MPAFRALTERAVRWRPWIGSGLEHLTVRPEADGIVARSVVIGAHQDLGYGVRYRLDCGADWTARALVLETTTGREVTLRSDGRGRWTGSNGEHRPEFDGCIDLDLAGSPFTNTLPIRRLDGRLTERPTELAMLYLPFDTFEPSVDRQLYRRLPGAHRYGFQAADGSFSGEITVDEDGLILEYPPLFARVGT